MKNKNMYFALLILMLVVSACGSSKPTPAPAAPTATFTEAPTPTPQATPTSPAVVNVGQNTTLGSFLVDSTGMTLYIRTKDTPGVSKYHDSCATNWPALLTNGAPTAGTGVTASMLGTTARTDGTVQVTYNGWPLYYSTKDKVAGDTNGESANTVWYVMTPAGTQK